MIVIGQHSPDADHRAERVVVLGEDDGSQIWVAVHEAGHAIAAVILGVPFEYVTLAVREDEIRHLDVPHVWVPDELWLQYLDGAPTGTRAARLQAAFDAAVMALAGSVAESLCRGKVLDLLLQGGGSGDLELAASLATMMAGDTRARRVLRAAVARSRSLLRGRRARRALLRVASNLHVRSRLEHDDVVALVGGALFPPRKRPDGNSTAVGRPSGREPEPVSRPIA